VRVEVFNLEVHLNWQYYFVSFCNDWRLTFCINKGSRSVCLESLGRLIIRARAQVMVSLGLYNAESFLMSALRVPRTMPRETHQRKQLLQDAICVQCTIYLCPRRKAIAGKRRSASAEVHHTAKQKRRILYWWGAHLRSSKHAAEVK